MRSPTAPGTAARAGRTDQVPPAAVQGGSRANSNRHPGGLWRSAPENRFAIVICVSGTLIAPELHKSHGPATILAGVSVTVAPGDVLGVVGPNGAGKSTLLRLLAGLDRPDRGSVRLTAGSAGYLPQEPDRARGERLQDYLARRTGVAAAAERVETTTHDLARHAPGADESYAEALEAWLALGGADLDQRAESVLRDLGLDPALLDLETTALSGGQAARAALAAILLSRFDVLLLD